MSAIRKFDRKADAYAAGRPTYAAAFLDDLFGRHGFGRDTIVADVGSGTGIFAKQLLERGSVVYAVEPNADMRLAAEREIGHRNGYQSFDGTAEHTGLADKSVDFVTAAQAFHWFDGAAFRRECRRILRADGKVFLIWNARDTEAEVHRRQQSIYRRFCPDFAGFTGGMQADDRRIEAFFANGYTRDVYDNPLWYDRDKFIRRCLSSSYALRETAADYADFLQALNDLFDDYCVNGRLSVPNKTAVYYGNIES